MSGGLQSLSASMHGTRGCSLIQYRILYQEYRIVHVGMILNKSRIVTLHTLYTSAANPRPSNWCAVQYSFFLNFDIIHGGRILPPWSWSY